MVWSVYESKKSRRGRAAKRSKAEDTDTRTTGAASAGMLLMGARTRAASSSASLTPTFAHAWTKLCKADRVDGRGSPDHRSVALARPEGRTVDLRHGRPGGDLGAGAGDVSGGRGLLRLQGQHRGVVRSRAVRRVSRRAEDPHGGVLDRVPRGGPGRPGAPLAARLPVPAAARRPWARDGRGVAGRGRLSRRARARGAPRVGGRARAADRAHGRATTVSSAPARLRLSAPGHAAVADAAQRPLRLRGDLGPRRVDR